MDYINVMFVIAGIFIVLMFASLIITELYQPWMFYHKQAQWEKDNKRPSLVYIVEHPSREKYINRSKWWRVWGNG